MLDDQNFDVLKKLVLLPVDWNFSIISLTSSREFVVKFNICNFNLPLDINLEALKLINFH